MAEREGTAAETKALYETVEILKNGLEKFKDACDQHIPFCMSSLGYINYIPERCFTTYFSWALINSGFYIFNEQSVDCGSQSKQTQRFDLLARRFGNEVHQMVQLKVEAKGDLESGYKEILDDIDRMEKYTIPYPNYNDVGLHQNKQDNDFPCRLNCVITQNWGLRKLSVWWMEDNLEVPQGRRSPVWGHLKAKLLQAKVRDKFTVLKSRNGYNIDVLYAFFIDPAYKIN